MKINKHVIFFVSALLLTAFSSEAQVSQLIASPPKYCLSFSDTQKANAAFSLLAPKVNIESDQLVFTATFVQYSCKKVNSKISYVRSSLRHTLDKLFFYQPKGLFDVNIIMKELNPLGYSQVEVRWPLSEVLSAKELRRFHNGETVKKYLDIKYARYINGNPDKTENYNSSADIKYILVYELNRD